HDVIDATGRKRVDDGDGMRGKSSLREQRCGRKRSRGGPDDETTAIHVVPPCGIAPTISFKTEPAARQVSDAKLGAGAQAYDWIGGEGLSIRRAALFRRSGRFWLFIGTQRAESRLNYGCARGEERCLRSFLRHVFQVRTSLRSRCSVRLFSAFGLGLCGGPPLRSSGLSLRRRLR